MWSDLAMENLTIVVVMRCDRVRIAPDRCWEELWRIWRFGGDEVRGGASEEPTS